MGFIPTHVYTGCVYIKRSYYLSPMPKRSTRVVVYSVCVVGAEIPLMAPRLTWDRSTTYHTQTALRHGKSRASEHWARLTTAFPPRLIRENPLPLRSRTSAFIYKGHFATQSRLEPSGISSRESSLNTRSWHQSVHLITEALISQ
jgi:hypothetical protein